MKVVAFNGSPRRKGNTYHAIQMGLKSLRKRE
jgi:multimeric flavodoxin WrbA